MKPTNKNLADFFGVTPKTIGNYANSEDVKIRRRYEAFLKLFIEYHSNKE